MIQRPQQNAFRTRHISEADERVKNDCLVAAGLMALSEWTLGEVLLKSDWSPKDDAEIKRMREAMRDSLGPDKQTGPLSVADLRTMTKTFFPWLPDVPFFDAAAEQRTWNKVVDDLRDGFCGLALGNPVRAPAGSKLRKWTGSDDYDHFVLFERAGPEDILVYNPLAPYGIGYDGEWVPIGECRAYTETGDGYVKVSMFERGVQSLAGVTDTRLTRVIKERNQAISAKNAAIESLKSQLAAITARLTECEARTPDCTDVVAEARAAALADAIAAIEGLTAVP